VKLAGADGKPVAGKPKADGSGWESSEPLGYGKTYTVTAAATGTDGKPVTLDVVVHDGQARAPDRRVDEPDSRARPSASACR
jgi:hypothetical protein